MDIGVDPDVYDLAGKFLEDEPPYTPEEQDELAKTMQLAIDSWFLARNSK